MSFNFFENTKYFIQNNFFSETTRQTYPHTISYLETVRLVVDKDGILGRLDILKKPCKMCHNSQKLKIEEQFFKQFAAQNNLLCVIL